MTYKLNLKKLESGTWLSADERHAIEQWIGIATTYFNYIIQDIKCDIPEHEHYGHVYFRAGDIKEIQMLLDGVREEIEE